MYILLFLVILLFLISMSDVVVNVIFHRMNDDDTAKIKISLLFGLLRFKFIIPYIDIILNNKKKLSIKVNSKLETKNNKDIIQKKDIFNIDELKKLYEKAKILIKEFKNTIKYILSKTQISSIKWYTEIGLDDAALTAIVSGALWGIKGSVLSVLVNNIYSNDVDINIKPNYSKLIFEVDLNCIIKIKIANIIIAGIRIGYIYVIKVILKKGGGLNERSSYRRSNENYNG